MNVDNADDSITQLAPPVVGGNLINVQEAYALPPRDLNLSDYLRVLQKRKSTVLSCLVVVVTVAALITWRLPKIYDSTARIAISERAPNFLNFKDDSQSDSGGNEQVSVDTQVNIMQADSLALLVIRNMGLDQNPDFAGAGAVKTTRGVALSGSASHELEREEQLIKTFHSDLKVQQVPNTSIIEIKFSSPNPQLAAQIANAVATNFIDQNIKARFDSTMRAADWLQKQLADLQIRVETSQAKLYAYQKEHNIIGADDKQNLTMEKLDELNKELTSAQSDRIQKESLFDMVKSGSPETISAVLQDALLTTLRTQQTDLQAQIAQVSTQFGSSYPKVMELANRLAEVNKAYQQQLTAGVRKSMNDYQTALNREKMLQGALDDQTAMANQLNENSIQYKALKQEADSDRSLYNGLLLKLKEASLSAGLNSSNVRIVDPARVTSKPARPNVPRYLGLAFLVGLIGGVAVAFGLEALDMTVRTPDQAESVSALPTIGVIPIQPGLDAAGGRASSRLLKAAPRGSTRPSSLIAYLEPKSEIAEAYRALRTSVLLSSAGQQPHAILVTSALPQDGKTMTSVNTAIVLAQQGKRVLLIDADLRRPSIHKVFGIRPEIGLTNVLTGGAKVEDALQLTVQPNLFLMPSGPLPPHPSELLGSVRMQQLIRQWRDEYDHVIIDSPPVLSVTDAVLLSVQVDIVILVIRSGQTTTHALRRTRDLLMHVKANVMGIVLNAVDLSSPDYYYYYYSGSKYGKYGYYSDKNAPQLKSDDSEGPASANGMDKLDEETKTSNS